MKAKLAATETNLDLCHAAAILQVFSDNQCNFTMRSAQVFLFIAANQDVTYADIGDFLGLDNTKAKQAIKPLCHQPRPLVQANLDQVRGHVRVTLTPAGMQLTNEVACVANRKREDPALLLYVLS